MPLQLGSASVEGNVVRLGYFTPLADWGPPPPEAFVVTVDGVVTPVSGVEILFDRVLLTLATAVTDGQWVTLSYTDPTAGDDANAIQSASGEDAPSIPSGPIANRTNTIVPTVVVTVDDALLTPGQTAQVTFTFSEPPTGYFELGSSFTPDDVTVTNGFLSGFAGTDDRRVFTATFTPTGDGPCVVAVPAGCYTDATGTRGGGGAAQFTADISSPTVTLSADDLLLASGETAVITFTFSEPPVGFDASDVAATGGAISAFRPTADPNVYTALFTPAVEGMVLVGFGPGLFTDATGNLGSGANLWLTTDFTAPRSSVQLDGDGVLAVGEPAALRLVFSEVPVGFALADVFAANGVLSGFSTTDEPHTYTAVFTASAAGPVQIEILGASYADTAGNPGRGSGVIPIDAELPWVAIQTDDSTLRSGQATQLRFAFSEEPLGFSADDIAVVNGALSGFTMVTPYTYTAVFTPTASGAASVTVTAGSYTTRDGHTGGAGGVHLWADLVPPTVTVTANAETMFPGGVATVTFTFSEAPTGFTAADVSTVDGAISGLAATADPRIYTASFTSSAIGAAAVRVAAGGYADGFGNPGGAGAVTLSVEPPPRPPPPPPPPAPNTPSEGPDVIRILDSGGVVSAGAGDDWVAGGGADDWMNGNVGEDTISAGEGEDTVLGGRDDDWLHGNAGDDMVFGDMGDDVAHGGQGDDFVQGNAGDDSVVGDAGDDILRGGKGDDEILGGEGADMLFGDLGNDVLWGGPGADLFVFPAGAGGLDLIADFSPAQGDRIGIATVFAGDFEALRAHISAGPGGDAVIDLGDETIVLAGIAAPTLSAADFLFA